MQTEYFFSVIIPTYNRPELLERAMFSLQDQEYRNFEVIVVNDGSSIGTEHYFALEHDKLWNFPVSFVYKENAGLASARNTGIVRSKGKFICFLDDDDLYLSNHLSSLYELIQRSSCAPGMYRTFTRFREKGGSEFAQEFSYLKDEHPVNYVLKKLVTANNVCIERSVFKKHMFNPNLKIAEDYEMWVRVLAGYPLFECHEHTTVYDRSRETMSSGSVSKFFQYIESFRLIFENPEVSELIPKGFKRRKIQTFYLWILEQYVSENNLEGFKALRREIIKHAGFYIYMKTWLRFLIRLSH